METTKGTKRIAALLLSLLIAVTMSFSFTGEKAQAKGSTYWLKVNKRTCVVTVYKYVPCAVQSVSPAPRRRQAPTA